MKKFIILIFIILLILVPVVVFLIQKFKPLPKDISYKGDVRKGSFEFLYDLTYKDLSNKKKVEQELFTSVYETIENSEDFLLIDFFLYNDDYDKEKYDFPKLSEGLTNKLIEKKKQNPDLPIVVITDPINTFYGSYLPQHLKKLEEQGIEVIISDLSKIKDANPIYSNLYRGYLKYIPVREKGFLPNIFRPKNEGVSVGAYLDLLNFKANHRKVVVNEKEAIVLSANPHDGSALHSNVAFKVRGEVVQDILKTEKAVVNFSQPDSVATSFEAKSEKQGDFNIRIVTEGKIKEALLNEIQSAQSGENLFVGVFYIGERDIVKALKEASRRGVKIKMVLDINKDAFGQEKIGIPNKQVASELIKEENIEIKWYLTQGEQFHSKMLVHEKSDTLTVIGGSANFTRRNLNDLNLETDLVISADKENPQMQKIMWYIDRIWENKKGIYTADYEKFEEDKWWKNIIYLIQEVTGLSTF